MITRTTLLERAALAAKASNGGITPRQQEITPSRSAKRRCPPPLARVRDVRERNAKIKSFLASSASISAAAAKLGNSTKRKINKCSGQLWGCEEDELLIQLQKTFGNRWRYFSETFLTMRTENSVKNRFCLLQKQAKGRSTKSIVDSKSTTTASLRKTKRRKIGDRKESTRTLQNNDDGPAIPTFSPYIHTSFSTTGSGEDEKENVLYNGQSGNVRLEGSACDNYPAYNYQENISQAPQLQMRESDNQRRNDIFPSLRSILSPQNISPKTAASIQSLRNKPNCLRLVNSCKLSPKVFTKRIQHPLQAGVIFSGKTIAPSTSYTTFNYEAGAIGARATALYPGKTSRKTLQAGKLAKTQQRDITDPPKIKRVKQPRNVKPSQRRKKQKSLLMPQSSSPVLNEAHTKLFDPLSPCCILPSHFQKSPVSGNISLVGLFES